MKEAKNVLRILKETKNLIQSGNTYELKKLSNQTIHTAAVSQDPDNIVVAVLVYSIGKVIERDHYRNLEGWSEFETAVQKNLDLAIDSLGKNDLEKTRTALGRIRNSLNKIEGNLGDYIEDIFRKAEINKAFKLYEHGLSSEQTAELLGISLWDLASYIGGSHIHNARVAISMPIKERIKIAEEIFG
jgi:hypothetical protein